MESSGRAPNSAKYFVATDSVECDRGRLDRRKAGEPGRFTPDSSVRQTSKPSQERVESIGHHHQLELVLALVIGSGIIPTAKAIELKKWMIQVPESQVQINSSQVLQNIAERVQPVGRCLRGDVWLGARGSISHSLPLH